MSRFLCISVTLLDPLFHGRTDRNQPEWPPSPMRLFQALVAGACSGGRRPSAEIQAAFRWLERQNPPVIVTPCARPTNGHKLFAPNNDADKIPERQERLTEKAVRPHRLLEDGALHYIWAIPDDKWASAQAHTAILCHEARRLLALGWGIDMAFADGRVVHDTEETAFRNGGIRWKPWPASHYGRGQRVPIEGSFGDLERAHASFLASVDVEQNLYRPPQKPRVFKKVPYLAADSVPPREYVAFHLQSTGGGRGPAFLQSKAGHVAAMLRSRACDAAKGDPHWSVEDVAKYVAGHAGDADESLARFSYLPLPSVGHPHADGLIRRVLIAEPYGGDGTHSRWARSRLNHTALIEEQTEKPRAVLSVVESQEEDRDGVLAAYLGEAAWWFSVTPVVLPGLDDCKHHKAQKLLMKALAQAGIDIAAVTEVILQKAPFWNGSDHPRRYQLPAHLGHLPRWHVRIRFHRPMKGPLTVGAGRHCGIGLFAREA